MLALAAVALWWRFDALAAVALWWRFDALATGVAIPWRVN